MKIKLLNNNYKLEIGEKKTSITSITLESKESEREKMKWREISLVYFQIVTRLMDQKTL